MATTASIDAFSPRLIIFGAPLILCLLELGHRALLRLGSGFGPVPQSSIGCSIRVPERHLVDASGGQDASLDEVEDRGGLEGQRVTAVTLAGSPLSRASHDTEDVPGSLYRPAAMLSAMHSASEASPLGFKFLKRMRFGASRVARAFLVYVLPPVPRCSDWASSSLISPSRISLPRNCSRVGLHIVLFEIP